MFSLRVMLISVLVAVMTGLIPCRVGAQSSPDEPDCVLHRLQCAVEQRSITQLNTLLCDAFEQVYVGMAKKSAVPINNTKCDMVLGWATIWLEHLEHPETALTLTFRPGYSVVARGTDQWSIVGLETEVSSADKKIAVRQCGDMEVVFDRSTAKPAYRITRWTVYL